MPQEKKEIQFRLQSKAAFDESKQTGWKETTEQEELEGIATFVEITP